MSSKYNFKLTVAYDGSNYLGYQDNKIGKTIESTLRGAIETILQEKITLQAASRTDRGVHAKGQIINFFSTKLFEIRTLIYRLNQILTKDIRIINIELMPYDFHPTLDARSKTYSYYINTSKIQLPLMNKCSWHIYKEVDVKKMSKAAKLLIGNYDFKAFTNRAQKNNVREILDIQLNHSKFLLVIKIKGVSFLYKMARNIVGTLVYVGLDKISPCEMKNILKSKDRKKSGPTAPPHGLFLDKIEY